MKINQQGSIGGCRGKKIERLIRTFAPKQVLTATKARLGVAAPGGVSVQIRCKRSHTAARRILPLAFSQRPIAPVRGVACHVGYDPSIRLRGKQYYKTAAL